MKFAAVVVAVALLGSAACASAARRRVPSSTEGCWRAAALSCCLLDSCRDIEDVHRELLNSMHGEEKQASSLSHIPSPRSQQAHPGNSISPDATPLQAATCARRRRRSTPPAPTPPPPPPARARAPAARAAPPPAPAAPPPAAPRSPRGSPRQPARPRPARRARPRAWSAAPRPPLVRTLPGLLPGPATSRSSMPVPIRLPAPLPACLSPPLLSPQPWQPDRSKTCTDIPPGADFTCAQQVSFGKCNQPFVYLGAFCLKSCNRCGSEFLLGSIRPSVGESTRAQPRWIDARWAVIEGLTPPLLPPLSPRQLHGRRPRRRLLRRLQVQRQHDHGRALVLQDLRPLLHLGLSAQEPASAGCWGPGGAPHCFMSDARAVRVLDCLILEGR